MMCINIDTELSWDASWVYSACAAVLADMDVIAVIIPAVGLISSMVREVLSFVPSDGLIEHA
jgi:hypothetical protein